MRQRVLLFGTLAAIVCLLFFDGAFSVTTFMTETAMAQEEGEGGEAAAAPGDDGGADAGGGAAAGGGGGDAGGGDETTDEVTDRNALQWLWESLGPGYMLIFLALSFTLVALLVMNLLSARRENVCPVSLVEGFEAHLNEKQYQEAYELAKSDESFLGQVLSAGLAKLSEGYAQAIEGMQEVGEEENMKLDHRLSYMALIGTLSPMIGLFGTVHGMIKSFDVIANSPSSPKPSELALGISTALFTTLVGLAIAIPAIAAYNILKNRVSRLSLEVGILSEGLMSRFKTAGEEKQA